MSDNQPQKAKQPSAVRNIIWWILWCAVFFAFLFYVFHGRDHVPVKRTVIGTLAFMASFAVLIVLASYGYKWQKRRQFNIQDKVKPGNMYASRANYKRSLFGNSYGILAIYKDGLEFTPNNKKKTAIKLPKAQIASIRLRTGTSTYRGTPPTTILGITTVDNQQYNIYLIYAVVSNLAPALEDLGVKIT